MRVASDCGQQLPLQYALFDVEPEESRRCLSFSREWLNHGSSKHEVIRPPLAPRVKETHECAALGIQRTNIAPFPSVAPKTSVGKVPRTRLPAMFAADNVVYLMRRIRIVFVKQAILTSVGGAFCDNSPQPIVYVTSQAANVAARAPSP